MRDDKSFASEGIEVITDEGLQLGLSSVRGDSKTLSLVSIPCTGGSVLQFANQHHPGASLRMAKHLKMYRKLWQRNVDIMVAVLRAGGQLGCETRQSRSSAHDAGLIVAGRIRMRCLKPVSKIVRLCSQTLCLFIFV